MTQDELSFKSEPPPDFKLEVINPYTPEQQIALYNANHPDQHSSIHYMTLEEIQKIYPWFVLSS